jgi:hypothetical protein
LFLLVDEPDCSHCIDKQSCRTFTKQVQLFFGRPVIQSTSTALEFREVVGEEQPYVAVDLTRLNLVEDKHVRCFGQQREPEAFSDAWLRTTGDEELDLWDLGHELPKDGQDCRSGFVVLALVQRVDDDHGRNGGFDEGLNYQLVHLTIQGLVDDSWIRLDQLYEDRSIFGVFPCELDSQGGEDEVEVAPVLEVSRAEEGGTEPSVCERPLRDGLRDGGLPRSSEPIQPVDRGLVKVARPEFDLVQNGPASSLETTITVAMSILGLLCRSGNC